MIGENYVIRFGKYKDCTVKHVYQIDQHYIGWLMDQNEFMYNSVKASIQKLALNKYTNFVSEYKKFVNIQFPFSLNYGKYAGHDIATIFNDNKSYCEWIINNPPLYEKDFEYFYTLYKHIEYLFLNNGKEIILNLPKISKVTETVKSTAILFNQGNDIDKISKIRGFKAQTIQDHLAEAYKFGLINVDIPENIKEYILNQIKLLNHDTSKLKPIKDLCDQGCHKVDYFQIKIVIASLNKSIL